jgi:deazaflavin-dependent oxidoreductase (nitroreductase family)
MGHGNVPRPRALLSTITDYFVSGFSMLVIKSPWDTLLASTMSDWNTGVIAEFRKNHGKVGGQFEGAPLLLINHKGAHTGKSRTNPVMYLKDGHRYIVFASKGGAPTNPDWYHNLKAHPDVTIEVGNETIDVHADEITGQERDKIYKRQASLYPQFAQYQSKTKRTIPIIAFTSKNKR